MWARRGILLMIFMAMIFTAFVVIFFSNPPAAAKETERVFEIEIADLLFLYLSDAEKEKLADNMAAGIQISGYYEPDTEKEGVTQKTRRYFVKRSGFISFGIFDYRLASHTEVFTKHKEANISRAAARKIRFSLPERVERHFVLRGLKIFLPTTSIEGAENLSFGSVDYRTQLVRISLKAEKESAACDPYQYVNTAYYKSEDTEMEIQIKAMLKIALVEEDDTGLVGVVDPAYHACAPDILDDFCTGPHGGGARIDYKLFRNYAIQSPHEASTWPPIEFKTTGVYGRAGNVEVLRMDSGRGPFDISSDFHDHIDAISFSMEWIRVGGRIFSVLFSHNGNSPTESFRYGILFPGDGQKRQYHAGNGQSTQTVDEDRLLEMVRERLEAAEKFPERKFLEHDQHIFSLDRSLFEREFDVYKNIIARGKEENEARDSYEGFLKNGLPDDDEGVFRYKNGDIATGKFRKGQLLQGALIYGKGQAFAYYKGEFKAGNLSNGQLTYRNGSQFLGLFREGMPHEGMHLYFDENEFAAGLARGETPCGENDDASPLTKDIRGKLVPIISADVRFRNGKMEGNGTMAFEGAITYRGTFKEGRIDTGAVSFSYDSRFMEYENGVLVYHDREATKTFIAEKERLLLNSAIYCTRKGAASPSPTASLTPEA